MVLMALLLTVVRVAPVAAQEFSFSRYTQVSGLRNLGIEQMLVDRNGDLWVATDGGIYRYDGTTFSPYDKSRGIPADAVLALAASPTGRIFARVDAGLYSGDADHFEPLLTAEGPVTADQVTVLVAPADDHRAVPEVSPDHGGPAQWRTGFAVDDAGPVQRRARCRASRTCIGPGCHRGGGWPAVVRLRPAPVQSGRPEAQHIRHRRRRDRSGVRRTAEDRHGGLWARSLDHLVTLDHGASRFAVVDPPHVVLANRIRRLTLTLDPMGRVVTRTSLGLARREGNEWQEFGPQNGLPDHPITAALADPDGNFWLAVGGIGLYRWHGYDNLESWTKNQGLDPESVWNIVRDHQHRLILGTDLGCRALDDKTHRVVPCPFKGLPEQETNDSAVDPSGAFWLSYQTSQLWRVPPGATRAERVTTVPDKFDAGDDSLRPLRDGVDRRRGVRHRQDRQPHARRDAPAATWKSTRGRHHAGR